MIESAEKDLPEKTCFLHTSFPFITSDILQIFDILLPSDSVFHGNKSMANHDKIQQLLLWASLRERELQVAFDHKTILEQAVE